MLLCYSPPSRPVQQLAFFLLCCVSFARRVLTSAQPRVTQFTGSSKVAEILVEALDGKVRRNSRRQNQNEHIAAPQTAAATCSNR